MMPRLCLNVIGIVPKWTGRESLRLGTHALKDGKHDIPSEIVDYFPRLKERLTQAGGTLSGGEQQMLALGRALAGAPTVLLLDEPSEGIQPSIVQQIGDLLKNIVANLGLSVLTVERSEEPRVGKECDSKCRSRWEPEHLKKKKI